MRIVTATCSATAGEEGALIAANVTAPTHQNAAFIVVHRHGSRSTANCSAAVGGRSARSQRCHGAARRRPNTGPSTRPSGSSTAKATALAVSAPAHSWAG